MRRYLLLNPPAARRTLVFLVLSGILVSAAAAADRPAGTGSTAPSYSGDTYSFDHQLGVLIDGIFKCLSEQMTGMDDTTVLFDGITEFLDPYTDGTQPFIFEFETTGSSAPARRGPSGDTTVAEINTFGNEDLFPEGFEDPETGTPLTDACVEIGIDDTLDSDIPSVVQSATLDFLSDGTSLFGGPVGISRAFFSSPWDGRLSLVVPGYAGQNVDQTRLTLTLKPQEIFADGFETGNTASWTNEVP